MLFSKSQLEKIAAWESPDETFATTDPVEQHIQPAILALTRTGYYENSIADDGGLSNYYAFAVYPPLTKSQLSSARHFKPFHGACTLVYLSLMVPVGAIGRGTITISSHSYVSGRMKLDSIQTPERGSEKTIDAILDAFDGSVFHFLDRQAFSEPLPPDIKPSEYCLCDEPWDRVFHVLFANTD